MRGFRLRFIATSILFQTSIATVMAQNTHKAPVEKVMANMDQIDEKDIDKSKLPTVFFTGFPPLSNEVTRQGYDPQKTKARKR